MGRDVRRTFPGHGVLAPGWPDAGASSWSDRGQAGSPEPIRARLPGSHRWRSRSAAQRWWLAVTLLGVLVVAPAANADELPNESPAAAREWAAATNAYDLRATLAEYEDAYYIAGPFSFVPTVAVPIFQSPFGTDGGPVATVDFGWRMEVLIKKLLLNASYHYTHLETDTRTFRRHAGAVRAGFVLTNATPVWPYVAGGMSFNGFTMPKYDDVGGPKKLVLQYALGLEAEGAIKFVLGGRSKRHVTLDPGVRVMFFPAGDVFDELQIAVAPFVQLTVPYSLGGATK